ncbi:MAG: hypothetical protein ABIF77_17375 [bacterium]
MSLTAADELKFVCGDRTDYEWVRDLLREGESLPPGTPLTISPVFGSLAPDQLAEWILTDGLEIRMQLQLHRLVWPRRERGI